MKSKKKFFFKALISVICVFAVLISAFFIWSVGTAYKPTSEALTALKDTDGVTVTNEDFGFFFDGEGTDKAMIFYPGARVEYTCYAPLMSMLARNGIDCFVLKMPCNMAFFGMNLAEKVTEKYSYEHWYISGHSLGGAMAAAYASKNPDDFDGAVLLAAYPTSDMNYDGFTVISIYGSEDKVLNRENFEAGRAYMPENYYETVIDGGNHAWFGAYGEQSGDGTAVISHKEQWDKTVAEIIGIIG